VKRKQTQPSEALAEKRLETNGSLTADYNGTNPLMSVLESGRQVVITHTLVTTDQV
jgi:hypothetical protein